MGDPYGPNVKKLIIEYTATLASRGGSVTALAALMDKEKLSATWSEAERFVLQAIATVKTAPDNVYGDDDEAIAGELLRRIAERRSTP